jgi:hypothetical protein
VRERFGARRSASTVLVAQYVLNSTVNIIVFLGPGA